MIAVKRMRRRWMLLQLLLVVIVFLMVIKPALDVLPVGAGGAIAGALVGTMGRLRTRTSPADASRRD